MLKCIVRSSTRIGAALLLSAILAATPALAATFTVNSTEDLPDTNPASGTCHTAANTCTLRAAVMQANRSSGVGATIVLPPGVYTLIIPAAGADDETNGDLNLTAPPSSSPFADITIIGAGAATTIIDGNQLDRVFHVHSPRTATISGVTVRNGYGNGILNEGQLTVSDAVISLNTVSGIANIASLAVMNSTITQNSGGGGISNGGSAVVTASTISHNTGIEGGGIFSGGNLTVRNSTISDNGARNGGGIRNHGNLIVINSTISQNYATNDGGGIHNGFVAAIANVYNTTIAFNGADSDRDGGSGGGIFNVAGATFNIRNSLVAGNDVGNTPVYEECAGTLNLYGGSRFGVTVFGSTCKLNQTVGSSLAALNSFTFLGPLQDNGGPTSTVALLPGSNAIDAGDAFFPCTDNNGVTITTDQRGAPRTVGSRCDVGAFEYSATAPPSSSANYEGLWWHAPAQSESGWGINFAHQGDVIFATWFTYDVNGKAWWLTMTANKTAEGVYSGQLIRTNGAPFNAFVPPSTATMVGTGTLTFTSGTTGTFAYSVNDGANVATQSKAIVLQAFGPVPTCTWGAQPDLTKATNYQDLWWAAGGTESGWGVNLIHQGSTIFATWFTYDTNRNPVWYSTTATQTAPKTYTGTLLRTNGPAFNAVPFNPDLVGRTTVGTATFTFTNGNDGTFTYQVNDGANVANQTKAISRQVFRAPGTVCG